MREASCILMLGYAISEKFDMSVASLPDSLGTRLKYSFIHSINLAKKPGNLQFVVDTRFSPYFYRVSPRRWA
jgi:hypothetical protein